MRVFALIAAGVVGPMTAAITSGVQSQAPPKTCTEAHVECMKQTGLAKECEAERQWCLETGSFANPKTKTVVMGLRKK